MICFSSARFKIMYIFLVFVLIGNYARIYTDLKAYCLSYDLGRLWNTVSLTLNLFSELYAASVAFIPSGNGEIQAL